MSISGKDIKLLWGRSASRCAICKLELSQDKQNSSESFPIGEHAHIIAENQDGPRGNSILPINERNSYANLILLCPTHHEIIDKNIDDYPTEKLFVIKTQHELWVQVNLANAQEWILNSDDKKYVEKHVIENIVNFVEAWHQFSNFYDTLFIKIDVYLSNSNRGGIDLFEQDVGINLIREWHSRRALLKELLFLAQENNLIVQSIPNWERLLNRSAYIKEGGYRTPFSFILDFVNPIAMVNLHRDDLWDAFGISGEFIEYLSYKYKDVKESLKNT